MVSPEFARMTSAPFATALVMLKADSARRLLTPCSRDINGEN